MVLFAFDDNWLLVVKSKGFQMFGADFFKIFHFVVELFALIAKIFGDKDDQEGFENHLSKNREQLSKAANAPGKAVKTNT